MTPRSPTGDGEAMSRSAPLQSWSFSVAYHTACTLHVDQPTGTGDGEHLNPPEPVGGPHLGSGAKPQSLGADFGFQAEMGLPGTRSVPPPEGGAPSLVTTTHNSPQSGDTDKYCPDARWVQGTCAAHGQERWVLAPCKRRSCDVCGEVGRYRIAKRIAWGVRQMPCRSCGHKVDGCWSHGQRRGVVDCRCKGMRLSAAWLVLTFATESAEECEWKPQAVKQLGKFVAWLRKKMPDLQYAATYELTRRGRLHINLIAGPWVEVSQAELQNRWGARVSVEWVRDDQAIGRVGKYLSKLKQSVPEEWGRRVSFSQKWPKLPKECKRRGSISWVQEWALKPSELAVFEFEKERGWWQEVRIGEWSSTLRPPSCDCFDLVPPEEGARDGVP